MTSLSILRCARRKVRSMSLVRVQEERPRITDAVIVPMNSLSRLWGGKSLCVSSYRNWLKRPRPAAILLRSSVSWKSWKVSLHS
eukprot:9367103-Pyramimonas_sp.AAC.1